MHNDPQDETPKATRALAEQHVPLLRKGLAWIPQRLRHVVDEGDLLGFGALGLMAALRLYNPTSPVPFSDYALFKIRGAMLDGVRKLAWFPRSAHKKVPMRMCGEDRLPVIEASASPDELGGDFLSEEKEDELHAALASLPTELRLVLTLTYFRGLSIDETAAELALPPATVKRRLHNALETLRDTISHR